MSTIKIDSVLSTYRFYAPIYDFVFGAVLEPGRKALAAGVSAVHPKTLLEVGVGTGLLLERYPSDTAITGIDVSESMLEVARRRTAPRDQNRIRLMTMNAEAMSFPDGSFDCVTLPYVLSVTPDPDRLIAEVRRVCRKDGKIFVLNHFSGSRFWWLLEQIARPISDRIGFRSTFEYQHEILAHDWQVERVTPTNFRGLSKLIEIRNG